MIALWRCVGFGSLGDTTYDRAVRLTSRAAKRHWRTFRARIWDVALPQRADLPSVERQPCSPILLRRTPYRERAGTVEAAMVEYLLEAKRFIQCARAAYSAEARDQDLDMAEWCITRAIEEARHKSPQKATAKPAGQAATKPN